MSEAKLSVREIQEKDIDHIIHYWMNADPAFLTGMGVDLAKIPTVEEWRNMLSAQIHQSVEEKQSYCIIWLVDGKAVGHSNVNKIIFGEEAYMHLHMWQTALRKKGYGTELVRKTLPYFFSRLQLQRIYCEPYALNPAPNKTLEKLGFTFVKRYVTIPGSLNFEQEVNRWEITREYFQSHISIDSNLDD